MPSFPSLEWMHAYAAALAAHERADHLAGSLDGVYRFLIRPGGPVTDTHRYDLEIRPGDPVHVEASVAQHRPARLEVAADYPRWRDLVTGKADFVMSYLLRRVKIEGDLAGIRAHLRDAKPLLDCLRRVETIPD